MNYNVINTNEKKIAGFFIRTTNKNGQSIKDQSEFWEEFFTKGLNNKISNKKFPDEILGVYFDYAGDHTGDYSFLIGYEVNDFKNIQEGVTSLSITSGKFAFFTDKEKRSIGEKVGLLWNRIWNTKIERLYNKDFEVYKLDSMNSENPRVAIFVGIK